MEKDDFQKIVQKLCTKYAICVLDEDLEKRQKLKILLSRKKQLEQVILREKEKQRGRDGEEFAEVLKKNDGLGEIILWDEEEFPSWLLTPSGKRFYAHLRAKYPNKIIPKATEVSQRQWGSHENELKQIITDAKKKYGPGATLEPKEDTNVKMRNGILKGKNVMSEMNEFVTTEKSREIVEAKEGCCLSKECGGNVKSQDHYIMKLEEIITERDALLEKTLRMSALLKEVSTEYDAIGALLKLEKDAINPATLRKEIEKMREFYKKKMKTFKDLNEKLQIELGKKNKDLFNLNKMNDELNFKFRLCEERLSSRGTSVSTTGGSGEVEISRLKDQLRDRDIQFEKLKAEFKFAIETETKKGQTLQIKLRTLSRENDRLKGLAKDLSTKNLLEKIEECEKKNELLKKEKIELIAKGLSCSEELSRIKAAYEKKKEIRALATEPQRTAKEKEYELQRERLKIENEKNEKIANLEKQIKELKKTSDSPVTSKTSDSPVTSDSPEKDVLKKIYDLPEFLSSKIDAQIFNQQVLQTEGGEFPKITEKDPLVYKKLNFYKKDENIEKGIKCLDSRYKILVENEIIVSNISKDENLKKHIQEIKLNITEIEKMFDKPEDYEHIKNNLNLLQTKIVNLKKYSIFENSTLTKNIHDLFTCVISLEFRIRNIFHNNNMKNVVMVFFDSVKKLYELLNTKEINIGRNEKDKKSLEKIKIDIEKFEEKKNEIVKKSEDNIINNLYGDREYEIEATLFVKKIVFDLDKTIFGLLKKYFEEKEYEQQNEDMLKLKEYLLDLQLDE